MKIVNRVYAGTVKNLDFADSLHHTGRNRPKMLVFKLEFGTLLLFPTMKFRLMGVKCEDAHEKMKEIGIPIVSFRLQTLSISGNVGKSLNLDTLSRHLPSRGFKVVCERELFSSLLVKTRHGTINLFTSGKCIFLGVDSILSCYQILHLLKL